MSAYAIVSDIHGNFDALRIVWSVLEQEGMADGLILNAGDTVAYGQHSEECITFLRKHTNVRNVCGNYDVGVLRFPEKAADYERKWGRSRPEKFEAIRSASDAISDSSREWLRDLTVLEEIELAGFSISLSHYAPNSPKEGLGSWTHQWRFEEIARETHYDIIVVGHTHSPFVRPAEGTIFINPGSVGRGWSGIYFAILTIEPGGKAYAEIRRCPA